MPKRDKQQANQAEEAIPRITDIAGVEPVTPAVPLRDFINAELTILGFEEREGEYGPFVVMTCLKQNGEQVRVTTGASAVVTKLRILEEKDVFPVRAKVVKVGRLFDLQ